jgi:hypothetical protein
MSTFKGVDFEQVFTIGDDDSLPKTGSTDIILLEESFEGNDIPESWEIIEIVKEVHLVLQLAL